ncbi:MAG: hypothetical protein Kow00124_21490 [Anaerolineae bacterium]
MRSREDRARCLQQALAINPQNELALKGLRALGIEPATPQPAEPVSLVPLPDEEAIASARIKADWVVAEMRREAELGQLAIAWAETDADDQPAFAGRYRRGIDPLIFAIIAGVLIVVLVVFGVSRISSTMRRPQAAAPVATSTPPPTAAPTAEPRPTRTPTPEGFEEVLEPVLNPGSAPRGDVRFGITPTPIYINTPHPANPRLSDAVLAFAEKRYEDSLELIEQARANRDDEVDGYYYEAMALYSLGRYEEAAAAVDAGLALDDGFAPLYVARGLMLQRDGAVERARQAFEQAKSLDPNLLDPYIYLARSYLAQGSYELAADEIAAARSLGRYEYNIDLITTEGEIALATGDVERAVILGKLAYYIDPTAEAAVTFLARSRLALGAVGAAVVGLEDYLDQINPASAKAWTLLGTAYGMQGRPDDGLAAYERALLITNDVPEALIARGLFYLNSGEYAAAIEDLSRALESQPDRMDAHLGRAQAAFAEGDYALALIDLEAIRSRQQTADPAVEALYVQALVEDARYEDAIAAAAAALTTSLSPEQRGQVLEARGRAYFALGQLEDAARDLQEARTLQDTGTRRYYHALVLAEQGQIDAAIGELEWLLFWDTRFDYPFGDEAASRLEALYAQREASGGTS